MCAALDLGGYIRPTSSTIPGTGGREGNAASTMIFDGETDRRWRTELFSVIAVTAMRGICGSRLRERFERLRTYEPLMLYCR
jgi:hypothetical protein